MSVFDADDCFLSGTLGDDKLFIVSSGREGILLIGVSPNDGGVSFRTEDGFSSDIGGETRGALSPSVEGATKEGETGWIEID